MGGILQVDTIQNNNATTLITQTNSTTLTFGVSGQNIIIPSGVTFNTASATVTLPSTINATTINVTTLVLAAGVVGTPSLTTSGDTNTGIFFPTADTIAFTEGGTEAMRIDSSGRVGIGVTSPVQRLQLPENTNVGFNGGTNNAKIGGIMFGTDANFVRYGMIDSFRTSDAANIDLRFYTMAGDVGGVQERMRIDASGNVLVGATSAATPSGVTSKFVSQGDFTGSNFGAAISSTAATGVDHYYISFQTATNTQRGYIYYNNGAGQVQLNATSDIRLKENIVNAPLALPILEQVKVRQYDWKDTGNTNIGFVAQELYDLIPRAVAVGEDNEDGSIKRAWGVDNGTLVPYLVKAIQEQQAIIEELKATSTSQQTKIDSLEARLTALENK